MTLAGSFAYFYNANSTPNISIHEAQYLVITQKE